MVEQIRNGDADAGITGFDILSEMRQEGDNLVVVAEDLGYSQGRLAIAVPEEWIDVPYVDRPCRSGRWNSGKEGACCALLPRFLR